MQNKLLYINKEFFCLIDKYTIAESIIGVSYGTFLDSYEKENLDLMTFRGQR